MERIKRNTKEEVNGNKSNTYVTIEGRHRR